MGKNAIIVIYVLAMVATVVIVDILFFRHRFGERLIANIGIVLVYVAFYLAFLKNR
jgi:preprotein translocase subunit SecE